LSKDYKCIKWQKGNIRFLFNYNRLKESTGISTYPLQIYRDDFKNTLGLPDNGAG